MEALILAGGLGTRLRSVVADLPKPMADVQGRPFLAYLLDYLLYHGITRTVLCVSYRYEAIESHFGTAYRDMEIAYSIERERLGTGGGIRLAMDQVTGDDVLVLNGDSFFDAGVSKLRAEYEASGAALSIALKVMDDCTRYGRVETDDTGRIVAFREKQPGVSGLINGGIYLIDRSWFTQLDVPEVFSFEKDVMEALCRQTHFQGVPFNDYFIDIGIPEDYARANTELPERCRRYIEPT